LCGRSEAATVRDDEHIDARDDVLIKPGVKYRSYLNLDPKFFLYLADNAQLRAFPSFQFATRKLLFFTFIP
jgi:hypothetical protein